MSLYARHHIVRNTITPTQPHPLQTSLAPIARLLVGPSAEAIPVHTHILLARCPYIKALVSSNMKESLQGSTSFQLPELTVVGVEQVVQYMYSGCFSVSSATVVEVMEAAKYLLMTGVEQRCADYIAQHLDIASAADLLDTAVAMQSIPMQQVVLGYVCTHAQVCSMGGRREDKSGVNKKSVYHVLHNHPYTSSIYTHTGHIQGHCAQAQL